MTKPLILPKHVADAVRSQRDSAVAASISNSAVNRLTSDDFVSHKDVVEQLEQLQAHIEDRVAVDPNYALPKPLGWRLLVLMLTIPETSAGGVHLVDDSREARAMASPQGVVLEMGEAVYQDPSRFAVGDGIHAWVQVGDRILWKKYDVSTFQLANGQRLGFMNDTQPVGKIDGGWLNKGDE